MPTSMITTKTTTTTTTTTAAAPPKVGGADTRYHLQTGDNKSCRARKNMYIYIYKYICTYICMYVWKTEGRKMLWHIFPLRVL